MLFLIICFFLTSCSKPKFTCKPGLGVNCKSMQEIHEAIKEDRLDQLIEETNNTKKGKSKKSCEDCSKKRKPPRILANQKDSLKAKPFRVWIAPFLSAEGYDISEHYIEVRQK